MIQCLNIVLLLNDSNRSFIKIFDEMLESIEVYRSIIDENRIISFIGELISGLERSTQRREELKNCKLLLTCLEQQIENDRLIDFLSNYLSNKDRMKFINLISQRKSLNRSILTIFIHEIQSNENIVDREYFDFIFDGLKLLEEDFVDGLQCLLILIDRMEKNSNKDWKSTLRLKYKSILKFLNQNNSKPFVVSKFIFQ